MSKERISICPRIQAEIDNFPEDAHPDVATINLMEACRATYDCSGPRPVEVEVITGYFRKRSETQTTFVCGLAE